MGILDSLNFSKKKKKSKSFKDIENGLPEDLSQFRKKPEPKREPTRAPPTNPFDNSDDDDFIGVPGGPSTEKAHDFKKSGFSGEEFGFSNPKLADHDLSKPVKDEDDVRDKMDNRHKFELILSKLETMDARLKLIEERTKRR